MNVQANGISFNCRIEGKRGAPWVVFSNSLATNLSMWDDQAAALADKFQILRYDHRGHGGTDAPGGKYSFDLLVADVIGLFDALEIERLIDAFTVMNVVAQDADDLRVGRRPAPLRDDGQRRRGQRERGEPNPEPARHPTAAP